MKSESVPNAAGVAVQDDVPAAGLEGITNGHATSRPKQGKWLDVRPESIPEELIEHPQWFTWREEERDGKPTKVPYTPGKRSRGISTDPSTARPFAQALKEYQAGRADGVGFLPLGNDPYTAVDLDNCRDPATGEIMAWAQRIINKLDSYTEVSPSGTGVRIFLKGRLKLDGEGNPTGRLKVKRGDFEVYDGLTRELKQGGRYVTVTGHVMRERGIETRQAEIEAVYDEVFTNEREEPPAPSTGPSSVALTVDDQRVINRLVNEKGGKGRRLFEDGDISEYARDGNDGRSEADQAFCNKIAFYTRDAAQIERIFSRSALNRAKWQDRPDYRKATIENALNYVTDYYDWSGDDRINVGPSSALEDEPGSEEWPEIEPLPNQLPAAPPLPPELLPASMRPWLEDVAERMNVPLEMVAAAAVVALGATVGRGVGIYPKRHDEWFVPPNLFGGVCGPPGIMKSAAISEATRMLRRLEAEAWERHEQDQADNEALKERLKLELDDLRRQMKDALKKGDAGRVDDIQAALSEKTAELNNAEATAKRYTTQDATVEKLGELLQENPRGLLLFRDELSGFIRTLERPGREGDREFYLEAWNGTGGYTFDRIGRGTVRIPHVCLSIMGSIQPGPLHRLIREALDGGGGADGLLQRFQVVVWPEHLGEWRNVDRYPDRAAAERAYLIFKRLSELDGAALGVPPAYEGDTDPPGLHFDAEAQELFDEWRGHLEARLRDGSMSGAPAFESHMSKYRSLMPSLALIFHLVELVDGQTESTQVSLSAAQLASAWCDYLELHARRIYAAETNTGVIAAHALMEKISDGAIKDGATVRDIYRAGWEGLADRTIVQAALAVLEEHHAVRVVEEQTGGRSRAVVRLHPALRGAE